MMQRMWMVNEIYEEKNANLMWKTTTFTVTLVKYQIDSSVDKGITEDMIDNLVQTKYEDLFGDQEDIDSGNESVQLTTPNYENLYPIYKSDATRKYITIYKIEIFDANSNGAFGNNGQTLYHKGSVVADSYYKFSDKGYIDYHRQVCGNDLTFSFIVNFDNVNEKSVNIFQIGDFFTINVSKKNGKIHLKTTIFNVFDNIDGWLFVVIRSSFNLQCSDIMVYKYSYPSNIPLYKLQSHNYYFDFDNPIVYKTFNDILNIETKSIIQLNGGEFCITNVKVFDMYVSNISEILQQYPSNQHLLVNDTARPLYGLQGKNQN